jgi:hypothetical protein
MDLTKLEDWFNPIKVTNTISVIGSGALGSWMIEGLVRMGFTNINIYDDDVVNPHNISNQNFLESQVGEEKIKCMLERAKSINSSVKIKGHGRYIFNKEEGNYLSGFVFLCLDNIDTRRMIVENNQYVRFWTDIRIGLEEGQVYSAKREDRQQLLDTMQWKQDDPDRVVKVSACGRELGILPTVWLVISQALNNFVLYLKEEESFKTILSDSVAMKMVAFK